MRVARLLAVARKETIHIRRDPRSLGMAFAIPMTLLFLYGYALTLDVKNLRTVVYDQDGTALSRDFLARFQESGYFAVVAIARSHADAERHLETGRAQVGLVIPPNFGRDLDLGRRVSVQAFLDGSDSNTATLALAYLEGITGRYSDRILTERAGLAHPGLPVETRLRVWYNPELESRSYIIPGLIAVIMMVIAALLTSLTVAREWEQGTMEQLIATPIRVPELVLGKLLPYFGIGLLDVTLAVLAGTLVFGVPFRGNVALLLGLALLFLLGAQSLGLLISIKARSQVVASQVALTVTFLPGFLLSGFIFDIGNLPPWLQAITFAVPARYFVTILKGIFLKGVGLQVLGLDAAFLALFALAVTAAAHRAFRKNLE
jgi:ABC-2 type transport system permease protein